ncbi:hypothetical protein J6590_094570 [Homalodisca vitripennis]|nr:hypothetical protein J6590_094570 [Homalodisca vitripennis]
MLEKSADTTTATHAENMRCVLTDWVYSASDSGSAKGFIVKYGSNPPPTSPQHLIATRLCAQTYLQV